jgi:hypothetical protein
MSALKAENERLRAELADLKRLGRSGYTITMERKLRDACDVAREAEAMCRSRSDLTGMAETAANLRAVLAKCDGDDSLHFARLADSYAAQLRELCEAAEAYVNAEDDDRAEEFDALVAVLAKVTP